ncbi:MAG: hypothetical protein F6K03_04190 [Kamptonema sp. SIO4C4]|nr:hypothetical protein [Kamptonema sp. SIO4C4]
MEALSFTHMVLAEDEAEFLAARAVQLPIKETTSLLLIAAVQGGYAQASETFTLPLEPQETVTWEKEVNFEQSLPSQWETASNPNEAVSWPSENNTEWTAPPDTLEKTTKPEPPTKQQVAKAYGAYPRPYYSRARLPEELKISPFHLVNRAYRGGYKESGIPSYGVFITAYRQGKLDAKDLIRAGVIQGRLTTADLYNPAYISAVESQLDGLI